MAHLDLSLERGAGCDLRDTQVSAEDFVLRTCLDQAEFGQKRRFGIWPGTTHSLRYAIREVITHS